MAVPYEIFAIGYSITIFTATIAALFFFIGPQNIRISILSMNIKKNWILLLFMIILPMIMMLESGLANSIASSSDAISNTYWMYSHGGELIRYIQNRLETGFLTDLLIFVYVWGFSFIIYFTPVYLLASNDTILFKKFSVALILNYLILLPFYTLLPVSVTSASAATMLKPLLYTDELWGKLVMSMDPLNNDFPSGHISLLLTTLIILSSSHYHRRYTHFVMWGLIFVSVAILYLGIHWIMDILGGIALAVGVVLLVGNTRLLTFRFSQLKLRSAEEIIEDDTSENPDETDLEKQEQNSKLSIARLFRRTR